MKEPLSAKRIKRGEGQILSIVFPLYCSQYHVHDQSAIKSSHELHEWKVGIWGNAFFLKHNVLSLSQAHLF